MKSSKGGSFERQFCYRLSEWWTGDADSCVFWRTSQSGGRATVRSRKGKRTSGHHGDICATDPCAEPFFKLFCLELKRGYSRCSIQDLLDRPKRAAKQEYEKWVEQAELSRKGSGARYWLIVLRRDKREALVMFPHGLVAEWPILQRPEHISCEKGVLLRLDDFLYYLKATDVPELLKQKRGKDAGSD
jgi:hypothetical protein